MKKRRKSARKKLSPEENDLLSSFEKGEWKTVANVKKEKLREEFVTQNADLTLLNNQAQNVFISANN